MIKDGRKRPIALNWLQRYAHYLKTDSMLTSSEKVGVEPFSILF